MERKRVVIAGGGFAGVKLALELANDTHFDVTLITPRSRFEYHGAMYRSATGRSPLEVVVPLSEIFASALNVRVELDAVAELRPDTKEVEGESGRVYQYDELVMAVGYSVNYFDIEGMALYSENMYDITAAIKLRHRLVGAFRNAKPGEAVNVSVIGAGPTGVEVASDIPNFAKIISGKHGIQNLQVAVRLIEAGAEVLPMLSDESSRQAAKRLEELDIAVLTHSKVTKCSKKFVYVNGQKYASDITIWTAGNKANPLFGFYPELFSLNEKGRVAVSEYLNASSPHVFVIGDAADTPYSGMAQTAIHNAIALAKNLKRQVLNQHMMEYRPKKPEYVVPIGGEWALFETDTGVVSGKKGWEARRQADRWVLENFLVYQLAHEHWRQGERIAQF